MRRKKDDRLVIISYIGCVDIERLSESMNYTIVNDKNLDKIKDDVPVPKVEPVNCKDCDDSVCCNKGKDKGVYCPRCFEVKK